MKLKWEDAKPLKGYLPRSNAWLGDNVAIEVLACGEHVNGVVEFVEVDKINHPTGGPRLLFIRHFGSLARGKALAESLAAWWLEQKPMSKGE
jgi:hypothetical protein